VLLAPVLAELALETIHNFDRKLDVLVKQTVGSNQEVVFESCFDILLTPLEEHSSISK
jgi:hypothetical protein